MESEGPYKDGDVIDVGGRVSKWVLNGYSEVKIANVAHAEGRKAEEKEQAEQRYLGHTAQDFRELLELTNCMAQMLKELWAVYVPSRDPSFLVGFTAWKKARGIE